MPARRTLISAVGVIALSMPASAQAPAPLLTLEEAIRLVIAQGALVADARDAVTLAETQVALTRSSLLPMLTVGGDGALGQTSLPNQTYNLGLSQRLRTGTRVTANLGAQSFQNQLGNFFASQTALRVTQPLWRGFAGQAIRRDIDSAELRAADARRQLDRTEQQAVLVMAAAYYRIAAGTHLVEAAEQSLENAQTLLEAAEAKLALGRVSRLDVIRAQQLVLSAELRAVDARGTVEDARDQVRLLLRRDADFSFRVDLDIPVAPPPLPLEAALTLAFANRPELFSAAAGVREAEIGLDAAIDQARPQFDLSVQWTRNSIADSLRDAFGTDDFRFATFASVSIPVDPVRAQAVRRQAEIQMQRRTRELEDVQRQVAYDVRSAHRGVVRLLQMLEQADAAVEFAGQEVELASLRYRRGLSNNLDVVVAEGGLLAARARRFGVLADLALARLHLMAALGSLDPLGEAGS